LARSQFCLARAELPLLVRCLLEAAMLTVLRQLNLKVNSATYMETGPAALYNHQKANGAAALRRRPLHTLTNNWIRGSS